MRHGASLAMLIGLVAATPAAAADGETDLARAPSEMTGAEIDAYNAGRAMTEDGYIKCRRIPETGSLVRKARVCNTNAEWKRIAEKGNLDARETMETMARGWSNSQEPADQLQPAIPNRPQ